MSLCWMHHERKKKMTYKEYLTKLESYMEEKLQESEYLEEVSIVKSNGNILDGLQYSSDERRDHPVIYVNQYYKKEMTEAELPELAYSLLQKLRTARVLNEDKILKLREFEFVKNFIYPKLLNESNNEELLENVPWVEWVDMAVVFCIRTPQDILPKATAVITTKLMVFWKVSVTELYQLSITNLRKEKISLIPAETGIWVLGKDVQKYGAAAIILPEVQSMCTEKIGTDFYMLPRSLHECIIIAGKVIMDDLMKYLKENPLKEDERLSDQVYYFDLEKKYFVNCKKSEGETE